MNHITLKKLAQEVVKKYQDVYLIVSPPRCSSTAFARSFWEHSSIEFYCHEPFDTVYYRNQDLFTVIKALEFPLNLETIKNNSTKKNSLVIKMITFQAGQFFPLILSLTKNPIVFVIRDPRLCIFSKINKLKEGQKNFKLSLRELGWFDLKYQINFCQELAVPYLIVDTTVLRNRPEEIYEKVFNRLELSFSKNMLSWKTTKDKDIELGRLGEQQRHWYQRVLSSTGIQPPNEPVPEVRSFTKINGLRDRVKQYLELYESLCNDVNVIR